MIIKRQKEFGNKENKAKRRKWEINNGFDKLHESEEKSLKNQKIIKSSSTFKDGTVIKSIHTTEGRPDFYNPENNKKRGGKSYYYVEKEGNIGSKGILDSSKEIDKEFNKKSIELSDKDLVRETRKASKSVTDPLANTGATLEERKAAMKSRLSPEKKAKLEQKMEEKAKQKAKEEAEKKLLVEKAAKKAKVVKAGKIGLGVAAGAGLAAGGYALYRHNKNKKKEG